MMLSPAAPPTKVEERFQSIVLVLLAPSLLALLCSILSRVNPGGAWWLFAGFGNAIGFLGIALATVIALIATLWRRISLTFLGFVLVEIAATVLLWWFSTKLTKNPFV